MTDERTQHTEPPWKQRDQHPLRIIADDGIFVAICQSNTFEKGSRSDAEKLANAAFIVLCVNSHAALKAACEAAIDYLDITCAELMRAGRQIPEDHDVVRLCRAALELTEQCK